MGAVGVSYIRKDHLPDWTQIKSHNNTKLNRMEQHRFLYLRRACRDSFIIYLLHGNEQPDVGYISTSSRGNLVHLRRARCTCKNACTEFRSSRFPLLYEGFHSKIKFHHRIYSCILFIKDLFSLVENFQLPVCRSKTCSRSQQCSVLAIIIGFIYGYDSTFQQTYNDTQIPTRWTMTSSSSDTDCSQFMFQQLYIHANENA